MTHCSLFLFFSHPLPFFLSLSSEAGKVLGKWHQWLLLLFLLITLYFFLHFTARKTEPRGRTLGIGINGHTGMSCLFAFLHFSRFFFVFITSCINYLCLNGHYQRGGAYTG